jgi:hypothetical protein
MLGFNMKNAMNAVNRFNRNSFSALLGWVIGAKTSPRDVAGSTGHALEDDS